MVSGVREITTMKMDIEKFKKVIRSEKLPVVFSSHQFIQEYCNLFEEDYIRNLSPERGGYRKLHGPIGSYLSTESASPKRSENNKLRWDVTRSFAAAHL